MKWAEIQIETTTQAHEIVANLLMENGCGGAVVEGEAPVFVKCYLPVDDRLEGRLKFVKVGLANIAEQGIDAGSSEITIKYAEDEEWSEAWKEFFKTTRIGKKIVVKPAWEEYSAEGKEIVIEIDPGMAFGTGNHATTKLCLELLEKYIKPRNIVVDFGTGSGILAIAAAKMRASLVIAFDMDEIAVKAARENVQKNDMEEIIEVHQANDPAFINLEADIVVANLLAEIIMAETDSIARLLRQGGLLIASGIITGKSLDVEQAFRNAGFDIAETKTEGEWVAIAARKSG